MLLILEVVTIFLTVVAMCMAAAHALEYPGKIRLNEQTYRAVQTIYYPGFSVAGIAEPAAVITTFVLLLLMRDRGMAFWWTLTAFIALAVMHAIFWTVTQPTNRYWMQNQQLGKAAATFFDVKRENRVDATGGKQADWKHLRDRWEYSHVIRAVLCTIALVALLLAIAK